MMTEFDRAYMQERREEHYRELRQTLDDEHRRGLNRNPYYGWTRGEIGRHEASLNADVEPRRRTPQEEAEWLEDKRAEYEADRICGHHWSNA